MQNNSLSTAHLHTIATLRYIHYPILSLVVFVFILCHYIYVIEVFLCAM